VRVADRVSTCRTEASADKFAPSATQVDVHRTRKRSEESSSGSTAKPRNNEDAHATDHLRDRKHVTKHSSDSRRHDLVRRYLTRIGPSVANLGETRRDQHCGARAAAGANRVDQAFSHFSPRTRAVTRCQSSGGAEGRRLGVTPTNAAGRVAERPRSLPTLESELPRDYAHLTSLSTVKKDRTLVQ
jgi:hypothetical protein